MSERKCIRAAKRAVKYQVPLDWPLVEELLKLALQAEDEIPQLKLRLDLLERRLNVEPSK